MICSLLYIMLLMFVAISCTTNSKGQLEPIANHTLIESQPALEIGFLESITHHMLVQDLDPSIQIATSDCKDASFSIVTFNDIPGEPPYRLEMRRLLQNDPNLYLPAIEAQKTLNEIRKDGIKVPFGILLQQDEYLPGERVTWRICSQDGKILKQATCCPNPKVLKNAAGKRIMEAALISINRPNTVYWLLFPPAQESREYIFTSGTKQSRGIIPPKKLEHTTFAPEIEGVTGGISRIEVRSSDKSYELELPWGTKLEVKSEIEKLKTTYLLDGNIVKDLDF